MRRKDREVSDRSKMLSILDSCDCCRLGLNADGEVYIVPLNFGYHVENDRLEIFFHCAKEGRKLDLIRKNEKVSFEMDTSHSLIKGDEPCSYSFSFQSIMGTGRAAIIDDVDGKLYALNLIMSHYGKKDSSFERKHADMVEIIKLDVDSWSCKEH